VAVVGTQHFLTDMPDGYTPAHLRLLLTRLAPDVLAVEAPSNVAAPWAFAPYELARVTKPWSDARRLPTVPAGWHEPGYEEQLGAMFRAFQAEGKAAAYQQVEQRFQAESAKQPATCQFLNSPASQQLWRAYHAGLHDLAGRDTPWET